MAVWRSVFTRQRLPAPVSNCAFIGKSYLFVQKNSAMINSLNAGPDSLAAPAPDRTPPTVRFGCSVDSGASAGQKWSKDLELDFKTVELSERPGYCPVSFQQNGFTL